MILPVVIIAIIILVLCASFAVYRIAFFSPNKKQNDIYNIPAAPQYQKEKRRMLALIDELDAKPYEQVYINSHDGLRLAARYYHIKDGAPLDIGFHGYRGSAVRDFCGGANISFEAGHNLLLVDQRAQGKSEGHTISFGVNERLDCVDWVNYARSRFGKGLKIMLYGVSMGASGVLMASGLELPDNVCGIIADSPYTDPPEIIKKVSKDMGIPPVLSYPFAALGAYIFGGFKLSSASAVEAVKHAKVPILLIHGEEDGFVPCEMSERIFEACRFRARRHTFAKAGHGISFIVDTEKYRQLVFDFLKSL